MSQGPFAFERFVRPQLADLHVYDVPPLSAAARLHANECPEPWPPHVMDALAEVIRHVELGRYPDTSGRTLRATLAARHGCSPERVVLGNGSDEVISLLLTALSGRAGAAIVIPTPTFVMYAHTARVLGLEVREAALDENLQLDESAMRRELARPDAAACFLARPNNPTGTLFDRALIHQLVAEHPATVFVIDEAYGAYAPGESLYAADNPPNMVHMATLSKIGLAALRVGYCIATERLALALNKVRHPYNISQTSLALAETILREFGDEQQAMIERAVENRGRLAQILEQIPGARVYPSSANLVLARLPSSQIATDTVSRLAAAGIRIKDVSGVSGLAGCIRVSVGTREELDLLADALGVSKPTGAAG